MTWLDLLTTALRRIGVKGAGEVLTADESSDALASLNEMLDEKEADRLAIYTVTRTTWTITASDGSGGDIDIAWPWYVDRVGYIETDDDPDSETELQELSEDAYRNVRQKAQTSTNPDSWYYNPTYPLGALDLFPIPTSSSLSGVIYHPTAITQVSSLSGTVQFPPGYRAWVTNELALRLAPEYDRQPSPLLLRMTMEARDKVKRRNLRMSDLQCDAAVLGSAGGWFDFKAGR